MLVMILIECWIVCVTVRRLYSFMGYFLFLYNAVIGIFSVLKRILLCLVIGTLMLARLDYVVLMRGFERLDSGNTITNKHYRAVPVVVVVRKLK